MGGIRPHDILFRLQIVVIHTIDRERRVAVVRSGSSALPCQ
jgi:hypothetical protein